MKTNKVLFTLATTALVVGLTGCGKKENANLEDQAKAAATETGDAIKQAADAAKEAGQKAAQDVTDKAKEVAAPVNAQAQGIIDAAKQYVSDGKLQEAYAKLKELGGEKLSAEQQAIADSRSFELLTVRERKAREIDAAKRAGKLKRAAIKLMGGPGVSKKLLYALASKALHHRIQERAPRARSMSFRCGAYLACPS